jgi:hypothetical protein
MKRHGFASVLTEGEAIAPLQFTDRQKGVGHQDRIASGFLDETGVTRIVFNEKDRALIKSHGGWLLEYVEGFDFTF